MSPLEPAIDALYQQPLSSFTAARNALAKTLKGEEAKRVRQLAKPTIVPWAVNQLYWKARHTYARLLKSGEVLRAAQIAALEGGRADVRRAVDGHRTALADAVAQATRLAGLDGPRPDPEPLSRMLEAVSLAAEPPEHAGRFTDLLRPAGFEALAGIQPIARPQADVEKVMAAREASRTRSDAPRREPTSAPGRVASRPAIDRDAERRARAALREAAARQARQKALDGAVATAAGVVERARKALTEAEEAYAKAQERAEANRP